MHNADSREFARQQLSVGPTAPADPLRDTLRRLLLGNSKL